MASPSGTMLNLDSRWSLAFPDRVRPTAYVPRGTSKDGFPELVDAQDMTLNIDDLSQEQIYIHTENCQLALQQVQKEYLELDRIIKFHDDKDQLPDPERNRNEDLFEEEKESLLYGYPRRSDKVKLVGPVLKDAKKAPLKERGEDSVRTLEGAFFNPIPLHHAIGFPEAFRQGGFIPTDSQNRRMKSKAADLRNIDGWEPVLKDGKQLVPRMNRELPANHAPRRKRRAADADIGVGVNDASMANVDEETSRPGSSSSAESRGIVDPLRAENKRLTRFNGSKVPPTRDVSEAPSFGSQTPRGRRGGSPFRPTVSPTPAARDTVAKLAVPIEGDARDSPSPAKRRKPNAGPTIIQMNPQYDRGSTNSSTPAPLHLGPGPMTPEEVSMMLNRKWSVEALLDAVEQNHSWLNADPAKALRWKDKIVASKFPVRTLSMFKKWAEWRDKDQARRPRNKVGGTTEPGPSRSRSQKGGSESRSLRETTGGTDSDYEMRESRSLSGVESRLEHHHAPAAMRSGLRQELHLDDIDGGAMTNGHAYDRDATEDELDRDQVRQPTPQDMIAASSHSPEADRQGGRDVPMASIEEERNAPPDMPPRRLSRASIGRMSMSHIVKPSNRVERVGGN